MSHRVYGYKLKIKDEDNDTTTLAIQQAERMISLHDEIIFALGNFSRPIDHGNVLCAADVTGACVRGYACVRDDQGAEGKELGVRKSKIRPAVL